VKGLLPDDNRITWESWCHFIQCFQDFDKSEVTKRYHYGELRLTRLNFYGRLFFYEWNYFDTYTQYGWYFARFMAPYLFVFGSITVILTAMQTSLVASPETVDVSGASYMRFATFSIVITAVGLGLFPLLYIGFQLRELLSVIL
jgi:hypothetical protein